MPATTPLTRPVLVVLGLLCAVAPLSTDLYLAGLPQLTHDLATTEAGAQLTLTAVLVGLGLGQFVVGPLSDGWGRRRLLVGGTLVFVVASVACTLAPSIEALVAARLVQGLGGSAGLVLARAIVVDATQGRTTVRLMGMVMLVGSLAPAVGPPLGGLVVTAGGWRAVLAVVAALAVVLAVLVTALVPETLPPEQRRAGGLRLVAGSTRVVLARPVFVGYLVAFVAGFAALFSYISASSFVLQDVLGLSARAYSLDFGANALAMVVMAGIAMRSAGRTASRLDPARMLRTGLLAVLSGALVLTAAALIGAPAPVLLPVLGVCVASLGWVMVNATVLAAEEVRDHAGTGSACLGTLQFLAGALVSPLFGLLGVASAWPMGAAMAACAGLGLGGVALATRATRSRTAPTGFSAPAASAPGTPA